MKLNRILLLAAVSFGLAACDSNDPPSITPPVSQPTFNLQVLHASSDAPAVNVLFNGDTTLSGVDYKTGSGQLEIVTGTYPVQVDAIVPGGTAPVIGPVDLTFDADTTYSVVAVGSAAPGAANPLEPVILTQPRTPVSAGSARAFVLHGAAAAPRVDVYVTAPGADLSMAMPTGTFSFKETLGPLEVPAGDYQIRVTAENDATVLYDSGMLTLNEFDDLLLTAVENTGPGPSPISIVAQTGSGSAEFADVGTEASLRVTHASPDAPTVDVFVNDAIVLVPALSFPDNTDFVGVAPGDYNVKVRAASNSSVVAIDADLTLNAGVIYDVIAVDTLASGNITALVAADDHRSLATSPKVRIIHASPTAQDVDIYVTAPMTDITNVDPFMPNVPFQANTGFMTLEEGTYDITVTPAGSKTPAIGPLTLTFNNGDVATAIAIDAPNGGAPLGAVLQLGFGQ